MVYVKGISYIFVVMSRVVYRNLSLLLFNKSQIFDYTILIFMSLIQDDLCDFVVCNKTNPSLSIKPLWYFFVKNYNYSCIIWNCFSLRWCSLSISHEHNISYNRWCQKIYVHDNRHLLWSSTSPPLSPIEYYRYKYQQLNITTSDAHGKN